jgi:hypothetical protein
MNRMLPLFVLALLVSSAAFAQTTTTYTVTSPVSGVDSTPFRAFSLPLTNGANGAEVNWLEVGANTACYGQTSPAVGFIFLGVGGVAMPCAPLTGSPTATVGSFQGVDANGQPFSGSYSFTITTKYRCSGGRGGGCHTVFTISSGQVTMRE